jgi:hypothetical protein
VSATNSVSSATATLSLSVSRKSKR